MDCHEIIRLKRAGRANAEIGRLLERRRKTVRKYVKWAWEQGFLEGELPSVEEVHARLEETGPALETEPPGQRSSLAAHTDEIRKMRALDMEMVAIRQRLEETHKKPISYEALRRLVRRLEGDRKKEAFVGLGAARRPAGPAGARRGVRRVGDRRARDARRVPARDGRSAVV